MKNKIIFLSLVFAVFHLSSCSTIIIKPKESIESFNYKINNEKTIEIINQKIQNRGLHFRMLYAMRRAN